MEHTLDEKLVSHSKNLAAMTANRGQRFINFLIDYFIIAGIQFIIGAVLGLALLLEDFAENDLLTINILNFVITLILNLLYYAIMEGTIGKTIGKMASGTRVVDELGNTPTIPKAMIRTIIRWIPFEALSAFSSSERMWHDNWTNTYVVDDKRFIA